jgi:hypothetical protein
MVGQIPGTPCSHCGRAIPEAEPVFSETEVVEDADAHTESPQAETEAESNETPEAEAPAEEEIELESGHVDNVGDETETPVP